VGSSERMANGLETVRGFPWRVLRRLLDPSLTLASTYYFELRRIRSGGVIQSAPSDIASSLSLLRPVGSVYPLIRIGGQGDGAYLIPDYLDDVEACFSPGVGPKASFEEDLVATYSIPCFLLDGSISSLPNGIKHDLLTFEGSYLSAIQAANMITLESWIDKSGYGNASNLILQADIEGAEYLALGAAPESLLAKFRYILIELHDLDLTCDQRFLNLYFTPLLRKLLTLFDVAHVHPNNGCGAFTFASGSEFPRVLEMTLVRSECNQGEHVIYTPHPLDVLNDARKPPLGVQFP
jgi:hypothetical protein